MTCDEDKSKMRHDSVFEVQKPRPMKHSRANDTRLSPECRELFNKNRANVM